MSSTPSSTDSTATVKSQSSGRAKEATTNEDNFTGVGHRGDDQTEGQASRPVADTSYLMPFGAPGHRKLLKELYPAAVAAPTIVRDELNGLAQRHLNHPRGRAAQAMLSLGTPIVYSPLGSDAHPAKERLLDELHADAVSRGRATGARNPRSTENAGEAECMCLAHATGQVLLCNDIGARRVAHQIRLRTRTTAADLVTLVQNGTYTANQMVQMARRMSELDIGDTISGPAYFRRPR